MVTDKSLLLYNTLNIETHFFSKRRNEDSSRDAKFTAGEYVEESLFRFF